MNKLNIKPTIKEPEESKLLSFLAIALTFILLNGFFYYYFISVVVMREDWEAESFKRIKNNTLNWMLLFTLATTFNYSALYFAVVGF